MRNAALLGSDRLIEENIDIPRIVAFKHFRWVGDGLDDLIQDGMFGLMKAVELYDLDKGNNFFSFAYSVVKNYMLKSAHRNFRKSLIPASNIYHLDMAIADDGGATFAEAIEDQRANVESEILFGEMMHYVLRCISAIRNDRDRAIARMIIIDEHKVSEVADLMNLTPRIVSRVAYRVRLQLRHDIKHFWLNSEEDVIYERTH